MRVGYIARYMIQPGVADEEWDRGRGWNTSFRERDWLGCKSETLSGSRLTARGHIRHFTASITQRRSSRLTFSPPLFPLHSNSFSRVSFLSKLHIANMGAIPEADPDEVLETKPFKFVTGKSTTPSRENRGLEPYGESMANLIVAGA